MDKYEFTPYPEATEIERKFYLKEITEWLNIANFTPELIRQGYLAIGHNGEEVRIRDRSGDTTLTYKSGSGLVRREIETSISTSQFEDLWPATEGRRIEKYRHTIPIEEGVAIELDVYGGTLRGLIIAAIEFMDSESAVAFSQPDWFTLEVTTDYSFKNQSLAVEGFPNIPNF